MTEQDIAKALYSLGEKVGSLIGAMEANTYQVSLLNQRIEKCFDRVEEAIKDAELE